MSWFNRGNKRDEALSSIRAPSVEHKSEIDEPIRESIATMENKPTLSTSLEAASKAAAVEQHVGKSAEQVASELAEQVLTHGYEKIHDGFSPPADSMTTRHISLIEEVVASLRVKEAALIEEIKNRELDLEEVQFTLFGYESALKGFHQLQERKEEQEKYSEQASQGLATAVSQLENEEATKTKAFPVSEPESPEQVDDPNMPETAEEVIPDQEAAQQPINFDAVRGKKDKK